MVCCMLLIIMMMIIILWQLIGNVERVNPLFVYFVYVCTYHSVFGMKRGMQCACENITWLTTKRINIGSSKTPSYIFIYFITYDYYYCCVRTSEYYKNEKHKEGKKRRRGEFWLTRKSCFHILYIDIDILLGIQ